MVSVVDSNPSVGSRAKFFPISLVSPPNGRCHQVAGGVKRKQFQTRVSSNLGLIEMIGRKKGRLLSDVVDKLRLEHSNKGRKKGENESIQPAELLSNDHFKAQTCDATDQGNDKSVQLTKNVGNGRTATSLTRRMPNLQTAVCCLKQLNYLEIRKRLMA
ncbi:hypothetical protein OUZ56_033274 [Daphnia magna]|uniref:Uncharacterized protein n=1 Tax=Daphnia magna TaxID=35525 RepID=A0ABR0BAI1_9CRUS|nr:hypothetical protein OUZ56_033274 [Daphnia magna]